MQTETDRWLVEGEELVRNHDYALALVPLNRVTRTAASGAVSGKAWRLKSQALVALGHLEQALTAAEHAVEDQPSSLAALKQRAEVCELLERFSEASADYARAVALAPDNLALWVRLGSAQVNGGDAAAGLVAYERALALDATSGEAWYDKGLALERLEQPTEALAAYQQAVRLIPPDRRAYVLNLNRAALLLFTAHRWTEALALAKQAQQADVARPSDRAQAWGLGGDILFAQKRYAEAVAHYEQALALEPTHAGYWYGKAKALYMLDQPEQLAAVIAAYDEALRLDPAHARAESDRRYARALQLLIQSTSLGLSDPNAPAFVAINDWKIWRAEASYSAGRRRFPELEAALNQLLRLDPSNYSARLLKALVQALQRKYRDAWATLKSVVRPARPDTAVTTDRTD